jgi:hypothetical protein
MIGRVRPMLVRSACVLALALNSGGCAGAVRQVEFQGQPADPVGEGLVVEAPAAPRNASSLGRLTARCSAPKPGAFSDRALVDVDCSPGRLKIWLREAAAERGGDVLAGLTCRGVEHADCSADLVRTGAALPRPANVGTSDPAGAATLLSYRPAPARSDRPPLAVSLVRELSTATPELLISGEISGRCERCSELVLRDSLRIAASRLGAAAVIGVRCVATEGEQRCLGEVAVTELSAEPQTARR